MSQSQQSLLFRQKLYENFRQTGVLSKLKTELRTTLLEKLKHPQPKKQLNNVNKPLYLRDKFLSCIVHEYLLKTGKQYTISILLPESGLEKDDCLSFHQLTEITNVNQTQNSLCGKKSFLEVLVEEWTKFRMTDITERSTQTDNSESVSKKLEDIERHYSKQIDYWKLIPNKKQKEGGSVMTEEKKRQELEYQRKRIRGELQIQVKNEVQQKYETKFLFRMKQIQKTHETRLSQIKTREKDILRNLQKKIKDVDEKSRAINEKQMKMIEKYERKIKQLELDHAKKMKQLEEREKEFWKKELQLKAKKRQYQDSIRLVRQKVIEDTLS